MGGVTQAGYVERVIVVPRNGLANRLQAWASAAALGTDIGAPVSCVWETETVVPATAEDLFTPSMSFMQASELTALLGAEHASLPRYLTRRRDALVLAGHDCGEQMFMDELALVLARPSSPRHLVIIAGGSFHLPGSAEPIERRREFYRSLAWSTAVTDRVRSASRDAKPYVALHVRQTDRSLEAPTARAVRGGLELLLRRRPERSLFIAADTTAGRARWFQESAAMGFTPWSAPTPVLERTRVESTINAAVDWLLLASSSATVHPLASTFSVEATVASGHPENAIELTASPALQGWRTVTAWGKAAMTYPARRLARATTSDGSGESD